MFPAL